MVDAELNEPQAAAAAHSRGPLLVFAGAGSGKTRVITYRVANLIANEGVAPWRILAVTFTNKAAGEMRARLETLCGAELARALWVGTFHATCAKLLRVHGAAIGVPPNFVIYDTADQKAVVTRALGDLNLDERRYPPRAVLAHIHKHKQEGRGPEEAAAHSYIDDIALRIFRAYDARLRAANAVDFEDLILLVARLLATDSEGDKIRRRFDHVLVDEFQDTNATQYRLLSELAKTHRNLCVVGDDDQSIYSWRGADVRNIRGFRREYPDATIVHTHRDPLKVLASTASLTAHLQRIARARTSIPAQATEWIDYLAEGNDRSVTDRQDGTVPVGRAIDIHFGAVMRDPWGSISGVYEQMGMRLDPHAGDAMRAFYDDNPVDKHGVHRYTFSATNLEVGEVRRRMQRYEDYFKVPQEPLG